MTTKTIVRRSPKASVTVGRFSFLWLDLWDNRYGLDFEWAGGRWSYSLAFGFGQGVKLRRQRS